MANYNPNEVVDILITLDECGRNYRLTARTYVERFPNRRHPNARQVINIKRRSRNNPLHQQRQRNRLQNNNDPRLLAVLAMVHLNPHISTRQIQRELGVPRSTAHRWLQSVNYHPYHITLVQELSESDYVLRSYTNTNRPYSGPKKWSRNAPHVLVVGSVMLTRAFFMLISGMKNARMQCL
ncbi:hypothetical protein TSAR_013917 [Trichomalopsis sarcophagae]|uniref:DUF4817 domain-containing protein n=1 Tax=Trichomalopsis sarcophagae TaxID=543379 RepID=A0A232FL44_9HYME|nr:hypothetical protein TSAR_013917 [Trichomalopsis sarcophagae]